MTLQNLNLKKFLVTFVVAPFITLQFSACGGAIDDSATVDSLVESGQQLGEAMVAIDDSGGDTTAGTYSKNEISVFEKVAARYEKLPYLKSDFLTQNLFSKAWAANCTTSTFSACTSSRKTRNFGGCTLGSTAATITGTITLAYNNGSCSLSAPGSYVDRTPNYTITGLRGANFSITTPSTGQRLANTGTSSYTYANSGLRRRYVTSAGSTAFDMTVSTGTDLSISQASSSRTNRSISAGTLIITNNLNSVSCTLTPSSVTWGASNCNCPTSGSWTGSCTDSNTYTVSYPGSCGYANITYNGTTKQIVMDRCALN